MGGRPGYSGGPGEAPAVFSLPATACQPGNPMTDHVRTDTDHLGPPAAGLSLPSGAPTSVGSLPHLDRAAAVELELRAHPELPGMPTLPALSPLESMLVQAGWGVAGVSFSAAGSLIVDPCGLDPAAPTGDADLAGAPFETWRAFFETVAGDRVEPLKLQLTGPVTFALALIDAGAPAGLAVAVASSAVRDRTRALIGLARRAVPSAPLLVVLDEPALAGGLRVESPIDPDTMIDALSGVLAVIERDGLSGVHCCGRADWRLVLAAGPSVLSLPVGAGVTDAAGSLSLFLENGGWIAWGAVPTAAPIGERASRYWKTLSSQWCELVRAGCDPVRLRSQALLTPECGLALHDVAQAEHVLGLVRELSNRMHDQALGLRLSVGA